MANIGQIIKVEMEHQGCSVTWLARELNCTRTQIYRMFEKKSIDTYRLEKISMLLRHNFFTVLSAEVDQSILAARSSDAETSGEAP